MDLLQDFGETQNLVNAWNQSANFLYQNRASRSNNDISAYCLALYPLKQVLIFRFMPSQFETHGAAASRTQGRTDRAPCPPRTDSPNEYPEPSERQQKTALHSQEPRQKHQQTENAAEDPRNRHTNGRTETAPRIPKADHAEPIRAEMLTGCRSHRRSHSPRSHHKTRRALYRCIHGQIPTAGANAPQNAIHGAGANRANLPRWTEAHRTTAKHTRSHTEPFLSILRTFTHRQINRAQNVKFALMPTKLIGESIQSIRSRRS